MSQAIQPKPLKKLEHDPEVLATRFSPCGKYLFGIGISGTVVRWTLENDERTVLSGPDSARHNAWLQGMAFHPDKATLFTGDSWGHLMAWTYAEAAPAPKWVTKDAHRGWMRGFALSPDGTLLATCASDRRVRLWSTSDGSLKLEVATHPEDLFSVQFHPDGKSLIWGDMKGLVTQWDLAAGKIVRTLEAKLLYLKPEGMSGVPDINDVGGIRALAFDPTGKTLACIGCQPISSGFVQAKPTVLLFDWETGQQTQMQQLADANGNDGIAYDAIFHPAGYWIVVSSGQTGPRGLWFWKPGEPAPLFVEKALPHCRSVSLHPDGNRLAVTQVILQTGALTGNVKSDKPGGAYPGSKSVIHLFETVPAAAT